jgi:hypothetical protein
MDFQHKNQESSQITGKVFVYLNCYLLFEVKGLFRVTVLYAIETFFFFKRARGDIPGARSATIVVCNKPKKLVKRCGVFEGIFEGIHSD